MFGKFLLLLLSVSIMSVMSAPCLGSEVDLLQSGKFHP